MIGIYKLARVYEAVMDATRPILQRATLKVYLIRLGMSEEIFNLDKHDK